MKKAIRDLFLDSVKDSGMDVDSDAFIWTYGTLYDSGWFASSCTTIGRCLQVFARFDNASQRLHIERGCENV